MTDIELTRACAVLSGFAPYKEDGIEQNAGHDAIYIEDQWDDRGYKQYRPLHDKSQAMDMVIRFHIEIWHDTRWAAQIRNRTTTQSIDDDLLRAICLCVAQMKGAK